MSINHGIKDCASAQTQSDGKGYNGEKFALPLLLRNGQWQRFFSKDTSLSLIIDFSAKAVILKWVAYFNTRVVKTWGFLVTSGDTVAIQRFG